MKVINPMHADNTCFLLMNGKEFSIVKDNTISCKFSEADAELIVKTLTGFEVAKVVDKLSKNETVLPTKRMVNLPCEVCNLDNEKFQFVTFELNKSNIDSWGCTIHKNGETIVIPTDIVDDILIQLRQAGISNAKTYQDYDSIKYVDELPEILTKNVVYVMTRGTAERPLDSAWKFTGEKLVRFTDEEDIVEIEKEPEVVIEPVMEDVISQPVEEITIEEPIKVEVVNQEVIKEPEVVIKQYEQPVIEERVLSPQQEQPQQNQQSNRKKNRKK